MESWSPESIRLPGSAGLRQQRGGHEADRERRHRLLPNACAGFGEKGNFDKKKQMHSMKGDDQKAKGKCDQSRRICESSYFLSPLLADNWVAGRERNRSP